MSFNAGSPTQQRVLASSMLSPLAVAEVEDRKELPNRCVKHKRALAQVMACVTRLVYGRCCSITSVRCVGRPDAAGDRGRLARGDATVKELTEPFELTQQAVSLHLKTLESAGLVTRSKAGRARPARLEVDRLVEAISWVDVCRVEWIERHTRLAEHLAGLADPSRR